MRLGACLSLSGHFGPFGRQAAAGLEAWRRLCARDTVLDIEDDASDPNGFVARFRRLAGRCDIMLGPYSSQLTRAAAAALSDTDGLLWNHGGAGYDVQTLAPGRVVSVLAPTSRYALPFLAVRAADAPLWGVHGPGQFGRQIVAGADVIRDSASFDDAPAVWDLLSAGRFEDDVEIVKAARRARHPPRVICSVAAGVQEFAGAFDDPDGIYGISQWRPGAGSPALGPDDAAFIAAFRGVTGAEPDYPAVQAAATAVLATHCVGIAGLDPDALWETVVALDTTTLLGAFKVDATGAQVGHETVLVQWRDGQLSSSR